MDAQEILTLVWGWVSGFLYVVYIYLEALFRQIVPPPMKSIDGETILVTGATGGIGKEMCLHLVRSASNIKLILWDLNQAQLDKFAAELNKLGSGKSVKVFPFAVDISTKENVEAAAKTVKDTVGPVTILFNNAGVAHMGNFFQLSNKQIEQTFQVNLMSHIWILREFLPDMVTKNHGRIVNTCSAGGLQAAPFSVPYFSSKFAVQGYTESLKLELLLYNYDGIHCTTVYPTFVQTPMIQSIQLNKGEGGLPGPFQVMLKPEDVARKAVDGMRREYEFVYVPSQVPLLVLAKFLVPNKVSKKIQKTFSTAMVFGDAKEQKRIFNTPYHLHLQGGKAVKQK